MASFSFREFIILFVVFVAYIAFFMLGEERLSPLFFVIFMGALSSACFWAMLFFYKKMMQRVVRAAMIPLWQLRGWRTASFSAVFGFVMSEIALSFYFLPFSFLTKAALLLVVFFVSWRLLRLALEGKKEKKHFLRELAYGGGFTLFLLLTTPWLPLH